MFKQRLKKVGKGLVTGLLYIVSIVVFFGFISFLTWLSMKLPITESVLNWVIIGFFGLLALVLLIALVEKIYTFIKWLFIEPYQDWKRRKKDDTNTIQSSNEKV